MTLLEEFYLQTSGTLHIEGDRALIDAHEEACLYMALFRQSLDGESR